MRANVRQERFRSTMGIVTSVAVARNILSTHRWTVQPTSVGTVQQVVAVMVDLRWVIEYSCDITSVDRSKMVRCRLELYQALSNRLELGANRIAML